MSYRITEAEALERPTAVIAETTTWAAFPALWRGLLDEVWAAVRSHGGLAPNRNVMLYWDDVPNVEVGVEVSAPFGRLGRVVASTLPAGHVVTTTHRGRYEDLAGAHRAIVEWCAHHDLRRAGPVWEIYGHQHAGSTGQEVEVYHLVGGADDRVPPGRPRVGGGSAGRPEHD